MYTLTGLSASTGRQIAKRHATWRSAQKAARKARRLQRKRQRKHR